MNFKRKYISASKYNKIMDKIIRKNKNLPIENTLIEMLEEASKWEVKEFKDNNDNT